ncbi:MULTISPECIES: hypothetical protein [Micrococcus]|uniref:hypothetical protein n=1 Tax=Micrococcus TaxID=1269 RepID=UPI0019D0DDA7|nr:hypothetical protein [Micrococcus sp. KRD096]
MTDLNEMLTDLVEAATLEDIRYFRVSAEEFEDPVSEDEVGDPRFDLRIRPYQGGGDGDAAGSKPIRLDFHLRVTAPIPDGTGEVLAEPVASYVFPADAHRLLTRESVNSFANEVAVMSLIPYAREAVASMALRGFRGTFLMPIIKRGDLNFDIDFTLDVDGGAAD